METEDMASQRVIVQASSRSWSGGQDLCMHTVNGYPVVYWTVRKIIDEVSPVRVVIAAPGFDRGGELESLANFFDANLVDIYYGHDTSPLDRMIDITRNADDGDYVVRANGLNFCVDMEASKRMLEMAQEEGYDCVKFPDDFPIQFTSDIYRIGALRRLEKFLTEESDDIFRVHPKYAMFMWSDEFKCSYLVASPEYSNDYLYKCRDFAQNVYLEPRLEVNQDRISSGDQLTYHYELALNHLEKGMKTLDIACGDGYGTRLLGKKLDRVVGADIDDEILDRARKLSKDFKNVEYVREDATDMSIPDNSFDAIVSMETIEHIDATEFLSEVKRVLKKGGRLILSTPQNSLGHIPVNAEHVREYSLSEILKLARAYFEVEQIIGIKQGCIIVPGDPKGTNTVLLCKNG